MKGTQLFSYLIAHFKYLEGSKVKSQFSFLFLSIIHQETSQNQEMHWKYISGNIIWPTNQQNEGQIIYWKCIYTCIHTYIHACNILEIKSNTRIPTLKYFYSQSFISFHSYFSAELFYFEALQ